MNKNFHTHESETGEVAVKTPSGFSLVEFDLSAVILLILSLVIFSTLNKIQTTAGHQSDTQAVLDNVRIALEIVERCIRQAGNDPYRTGFDAVSAVSPTELRVRSDITGSASPGNPDKGDPDGDINDSGEDLTILYNRDKTRLEMIFPNGTAQIIADNISGFSMEYFDSEGNEAAAGQEVREIRVTVSGSATEKGIEAEKPFAVQMESITRILT